jgi:3-oxoacyl-[acyl-carrier protein] reductase
MNSGELHRQPRGDSKGAYGKLLGQVAAGRSTCQQLYDEPFESRSFRLVWGAALMTTVILGATGTIGSCVARRLTRSGMSVLLLGRDQAKLNCLADELQAPCAVVDASSSEAILKVVSNANLGQPVSSLVNCIGSILLKPAHLTTDEEFREVLETNLFSAFAVVKCAGKLLRSGGGSVVLVGSAAAVMGIANHEAIASAKAGIEGLARSAAASYAPQNIRFNVVSPGLVKTNLTRRIWETPGVASASAELHALGRLGEPEHIASTIAWLVEPENDWITGQVMGVDGGLSSVQPRRRLQA